jgi:ribose transport system permease protein
MGGLYEVVGVRTLIGVPYPVIILALMLVLGQFIARRTLIGRYAYAIGGNEEASRLSGVRVRRMKVLLYALAGLFTGIAALTLAAILDSALPTMGVGYELQAIAAAVIGGVPLFGGQGNMLNALTGVLLLGLVSNSINIIGVSANLQYVVLGMIVVAAVLLQRRD